MWFIKNNNYYRLKEKILDFNKNYLTEVYTDLQNKIEEKKNFIAHYDTGINDEVQKHDEYVQSKYKQRSEKDMNKVQRLISTQSSNDNAFNNNNSNKTRSRNNQNQPFRRNQNHFRPPFRYQNHSRQQSRNQSSNFQQPYRQEERRRPQQQKQRIQIQRQQQFRPLTQQLNQQQHQQRNQSNIPIPRSHFSKNYNSKRQQKR